MTASWPPDVIVHCVPEGACESCAAAAVSMAATISSVRPVGVPKQDRKCQAEQDGHHGGGDPAADPGEGGARRVGHRTGPKVTQTWTSGNHGEDKPLPPSA